LKLLQKELKYELDNYTKDSSHEVPFIFFINKFPGSPLIPWIFVNGSAFGHQPGSHKKVGKSSNKHKVLLKNPSK
jgi:hypothetical protein